MQSGTDSLHGDQPKMLQCNVGHPGLEMALLCQDGTPVAHGNQGVTEIVGLMHY